MTSPHLIAKYFICLVLTSQNKEQFYYISVILVFLFLTIYVFSFLSFHNYYFFSSKGFLSTVVDKMVISIKFAHSGPF